MNEPFAWWLLIVGIALGVALLWLVMGRIPREEDDVGADERVAEASWISRTIASYGGEASPELVEEILDLHRRYLAGPALEIPSRQPADDDDLFEPMPVTAAPGTEPPRDQQAPARREQARTVRRT